MPLSPLLLAALAKQHWVASVDQLVAHDLSVRTVERYRRSGMLEPVLPGIVRLAAAPDDVAARRMAALLYLGELSALTVQTAGDEYGLRRMYSRLVHVAVHEPSNPRTASWIRVHRTSWLDAIDLVERPNGLRVLQPLRLLFEFAAAFPKETFRDAAEDMWHRKLIEPSAAAAFLQQVRRKGRTGVRRMEEWLEEANPRNTAMMSGLETDLLEAMERVGLPDPVRQYPLTLPSGERIHIDLAFPDVALGVEPGSSWWHGGNVRMRRDYERDADCTAVGWLIIRFDEEQLKDAQRCAEKVRQTYRRLSIDGIQPAS